MPSPFGEGQTDTPINRHNLGEVFSISQQLQGMGTPFHFNSLDWTI
jgi:hypothetical protein